MKHGWFILIYLVSIFVRSVNNSEKPLCNDFAIGKKASHSDDLNSMLGSGVVPRRHFGENF